MAWWGRVGGGGFGGVVLAGLGRVGGGRGGVSGEGGFVWLGGLVVRGRGG